MSRRKQPAPVRLPDLEGEETAGTGKKPSDAATMTKRSCVKGRHRKQPAAGLNGYSTTSAGTKQQSGTNKQRQQLQKTLAAQGHKNGSPHDLSIRSQKSSDCTAADDDGDDDDEKLREAGDQDVGNETVELTNDAPTPECTTRDAEDADSQASTDGPVFESDSPLGGGGGTTAGVDQVAALQPHGTGAGGNDEVKGHDADTAGCVWSLDQAPLDCTTGVSSAAVDGDEDDELGCSGRGSEEIGMDESLMGTDRYVNQEGERASDGEEDRSGSSSPTGSSQNNTPSKGSMKRRRPFESPESLTCQLCNIDFSTAHELTLHVRSHNIASSHSCNICGKKLSSTSSLDRHMLIHSGERPFNCPLCSMSFTTNGNMHRHLRTHEKCGELPPADYVVKHEYAKPRTRIPSRRLLEMDVDYSPQQESRSPKKKVAHEKKVGNVDKKIAIEKKTVIEKKVVIEKKEVVEDQTDVKPAEDPLNLVMNKEENKDSTDEKNKEEELLCPICNKTFLCRYGLQTHIDQHPMKVLTCSICNASFRNQKGLRMHVHMAHKKNNKQNLSKRANSPVVEKYTYSMHDLSFADFSTAKFPLIAQVWCEKNSPQSSKSEGLFACKNCDKSFPCLSALDLHIEKTHSSVDQDVEDDATSDGVVSLVKKQENLAQRDEFLAALCLKPCSPVNNDEEENDDVSMSTPILNSMLNKPTVLTPEKGKSSLLQQQLQSSPLLAMKNLTNPLSRGPQPMKHSPVKGVTVGSSLPRVKLETDMAEGSDAGMVENLELEPRSGDVAMEMHIPTEFASQNNPGKMEVDEQSTDMTVDEGDAVVATASDEADDEPCDLTSSNKKKGLHTCKYCKKVFPFASTLKVHTRSHMGLMPYKCMLCDYASADKSTLVRHMRTHSGERPFSCKVCDFAFTTKANCERHVRKRHEKKTKEEAEEVIVHNPVSKHENESKFSSPCTLCKICNRDFKFFRDLQNHLRVHEKTPQKPFTCIKCQVGFSSLSNCARHILRRHEEVSADEVETYITVYQHDEDKTGSGDNKPGTKKDSATSIVPLLNDNGEQIEPLDFSIKKERDDAETSGEGRQRRTSIYVQDAPIDLSMPKAQVTQEKYLANSLGRLRFKQVYHKFYSESIDALVCPHCAAVYNRGSQLKAHIRSHTTERPFRCYSCSAAFTQEANLEAHIIRRHNDSTKSQSFIPNIATPMQFKLMAKSPSNLRFTARTPKITVPTISPNTPVGTGLSKAGPSPHSSVGSDSSAELASVSKMLAATDSNHFKLFLSPPENRSPITVTEIFRQNDEDQDEESQEIMANISGEVPEMRMDNEEEEEEEGSKVMDDTSVSQVDDLADTSSGIFQPVTTEDVEMDQYMDEDEHIGGELQIVEEQRGGDVLGEGATIETKKDGGEKKEKRSTKFESKQCCPYCGRRFPWVSSLRRHILTHTGLKPYQCPQCGANFSTKSNCERHIVRRHGGARPGSLGGTVPGGQDQPFMCPECKEFKCTTRTQLQTHYEESHSHINFSEIYPEAKKVASTSVDIHNKNPNIKASTNEHPPADDTLADDYDKDSEVAENVATDLSMSKPKKKSKSKKGSLKVKLFINKGKVTAAHADKMEFAMAENLNEKEEVMEEEEEEEEGVNLQINDVDADQENEEVNEQQVDNEADEIEKENNENVIEDVDNSGVQEILQDDLQENSGDLQENERNAATASPLPTQVKIPKVTPSSTSKITPTKGKKNRARFECTQCCKRFKTALTLQRHEKVHEVDHPFHCPDCKAKFTTKFNCQRHMMKLHSRTKEDVCTMVEVKEKEVVGSVKSELVNGVDMRTGSDEINVADQELENLSGASVNLGDSVSGLADSLKGSRNGIPNSFKSSQKGRKRPSGILGPKNAKSPKLDEALISGTVLDLQASSDKLTAVENWLNSDLELQNGDMNGLLHGPEEDLGHYDSSIPVLNPQSPTASQEEGSQPNSVWSAASSAKKPVQQQGLYMASFLEDEDSLVAQDVANPSDVFSRGQGEEKNADIISNLLGIQDSSVLDQMLESPDSAARLLGVK